MFHKDAKVYYDGSHYIAIPHTENPHKKRPRPKEEEVERIPKNGEIIKEEKDVFSDLIPVNDNLQFVVNEDNEYEEVETPKPKIKNKTTKSEIFEELYEEALSHPKKERRNFVINGMLPYFKKQEDCEAFVDKKIEDKRRAIIARKTRFIRKAYMNDFNYFVTFTYDDNIHNAESFKKQLSTCLSSFQSRKKWKYMGVWEEGKKNGRLHFHGLFYIPHGQMIGELIERKDYNINSHKIQITMQNTYFNARFGRNDFSKIDNNLIEMGNSMAYILKYIDKTGNKITYSRGLPMYIISDIDENDVLCRFGLEDKKMILYDRFTCYDEGVEIGEISNETKQQLRTSN